MPGGRSEVGFGLMRNYNMTGSQEERATVHRQWCQEKGSINALPMVLGDTSIGAPSVVPGEDSLGVQLCQEKAASVHH